MMVALAAAVITAQVAIVLVVLVQTTLAQVEAGRKEVVVLQVVKPQA